MHQALYRKWRPKTFDDVVGQGHIIATLKQQVSSQRTSHAYLFTGTRGTGKTSCAKILSRAVNCIQPVDGNPCNECAVCRGIENGSILDVLEIDAASNNGVDQVRALRDEAVYSPAAAKKRVYIVDEVHMLSTAAFNALLKILEEPPAHLLFILATTELHKVPATIKSRCQQFAFKRILPQDIESQLAVIAKKEGIALSDDACALLSRLADGALRDALSLLDQCVSGDIPVDKAQVQEVLGLAGNEKTAQLMLQIGNRDIKSAVETVGELYQAGKEISSLFEELSNLTRDLLLCKVAPGSAKALLTAGYDEKTLENLGSLFSVSRLTYVLEQIQATFQILQQSANRRTDAELCMVRLCDERAQGTLASLLARVEQLEARVTDGQGLVERKPTTAAKQAISPPVQGQQDLPPWDMPPEDTAQPAPAHEAKKASIENETVPPKPREEMPVQKAPAAQPVLHNGGTGNMGDWNGFVATLRGKISPALYPYFTKIDKVKGSYFNGTITVWVCDEFTKSMLDKPAVKEALLKAGEGFFGAVKNLSFQVGGEFIVQAGEPEPAQPQLASQMQHLPQEADEMDALDELIALGNTFDAVDII